MDNPQRPKEPDATDTSRDATPEMDAEESEREQEYRREYLKQLRRLQCPGCGEDELF